LLSFGSCSLGQDRPIADPFSRFVRVTLHQHLLTSDLHGLPFAHTRLISVVGRAGRRWWQVRKSSPRWWFRWRKGGSRRGAVMAAVDTRLPDQPGKARYPSILNPPDSATAVNNVPHFFLVFTRSRLKARSCVTLIFHSPHASLTLVCRRMRAT